MKILIIGLGSIGKNHLKSIRSILPSADLFALRSTSKSEKVDGVQNIHILEPILANTISFAIISNPTSEHKKTILQLINYGFPLFIEKPLYSSLDLEELINQITYKSIFSYVACNLRFLNCIKFIKEQIHQQKYLRINEINVYCGSFLPDWRSNINFKESYSAVPELGGGVHLDLIHEIDYLYWIFGKPINVVRYFKNTSSLSISSFDFANYILDYGEFCANIVLNYYRRDPKRSLEVVFEDKTWNVNLLQNQIKCNGKIIFASEQKISDTYRTQMEYFINCVDRKINTFNTISDAHDVLKICLEK